MGILREMDYEIKKPEGKNIKATIDLPSSKSISNRVLIMNALSSKPAKLGYIAKCDDTDVMVRALEGDGVHVDIGAAGTAMRFLTAYYSQKPGTHTITGSERMRKRPIKILVDALNEAGANITYAGEEGFPPLKIEGRKLRGGHIELDSSVSSQYISALMMVAPTMGQGLELELKGTL
ncbi:MAG: 3-phosphoshikimate 1-carboxyvinyltransferase, partial [Paludibacteraceae bacterium]|nr:3-phosphoshikimate 1-carboxyvinyltransferase [Paludibacteraceae bacterium]